MKPEPAAATAQPAGTTLNQFATMKILRSVISMVLVVASVFTAGAADKAPAKDAAKIIPGWGTAIDPDGDCKIEPAGDAVKVTVPG